MCPSITLHLSKWMCSSITLHLSKWMCPSITLHLSKWMCSSITLHLSKWMCPSITLHLSKWMCSSITLHLSKYLMFINSTSLIAVHRSKLQIKVFVNNTTVLSRHELTVSDFEIIMKSCSIEPRNDSIPKSEVVHSTHVCLAQLDQHQTCKPVMASVVNSIPTGGNFIF